MGKPTPCILIYSPNRREEAAEELVSGKRKESSLLFWSSQGFVARLSLRNSSKYVGPGVFQGKEFLQNHTMRRSEGNATLFDRDPGRTLLLAKARCDLTLSTARGIDSVINIILASLYAFHLVFEIPSAPNAPLRTRNAPDELPPQKGPPHREQSKRSAS